MIPRLLTEEKAQGDNSAWFWRPHIVCEGCSVSVSSSAWRRWLCVYLSARCDGVRRLKWQQIPLNAWLTKLVCMETIRKCCFSLQLSTRGDPPLKHLTFFLSLSDLGKVIFLCVCVIAMLLISYFKNDPFSVLLKHLIMIILLSICAKLDLHFLMFSRHLCISLKSKTAIKKRLTKLKMEKQTCRSAQTWQLWAWC